MVNLQMCVLHNRFTTWNPILMPLNIFILMFRISYAFKKSNQKKNPISYAATSLRAEKKNEIQRPNRFFPYFLFLFSTLPSVNRFSCFFVVSKPMDLALKLMLHKGKLSLNSNGWHKKDAISWINILHLLHMWKRKWKV